MARILTLCLLLSMLTTYLSPCTARPGNNAIISLDIDGGDTLTTMARVIERHPFRSEYRHVDFVTVDLSQTVTAEVTIQFEGTPVRVSTEGWSLQSAPYPSSR